MGVVIQDAFTDTNATGLGSHVGEVGASWTKHATYSGGAAQIQSNRAGCNQTAITVFYASGIPATPDYWCEATLRVASNTGAAALCARINTANEVRYEGGYYQSNGYWAIRRIASGGTVNTLNSSSATLTVGQNYDVKLHCLGSEILLYVDGALVCSATDSNITAVGRAGLRWTNPSADATVGYQFDDFLVHDYEFPSLPQLPSWTGLRM